MTLLTFIILNIMFINESITWTILSAILSLIVYIIGFSGMFISKKIIKIGDNIKNKLLKILYYIFLPIVLLLICFIIYNFSFFVLENILRLNDCTLSLGEGLLVLFGIILICMFILIPYIETIIVLMLKRFIKE